MVNAKIPFIKRIMSTDDAKEMFKKSGRMDRFLAVEYRLKPYVTIYSCDGLDDYFYGHMVPDADYVKGVLLKYYAPGLILLIPEKESPNSIPEFEKQKKLFTIFHEYKRWGRILGVDNVGALNNIIKAGKIGDLTRVAEALQEKKLAQIADLITESGQKKRIVLISGPSSSGKTSFPTGWQYSLE